MPRCKFSSALLKNAKMKAESDEQLKKRSIVTGTKADLDRLDARANNEGTFSGPGFSVR